MPYNRYPAVDEFSRFPPEIRQAFAESDEFYLVIKGILDDPISPVKPAVVEALESLSAESSTALSALVQVTIDNLATTPGTAVYNLIQDRVLAALTVVAPGAVQDYSTRETDFATTNVTLGSLSAGSIVDGLELSVVGTGRPVELTFFCGLAYHSVVDGFVSPYLISSVNGAAYSATSIDRIAAISSPFTNQGRGLSAIWDVDTVDGDTYAFKLGIAGSAGTATLRTSDGTYPYSFKARNH